MALSISSKRSRDAFASFTLAWVARIPIWSLLSASAICATRWVISVVFSPKNGLPSRSALRASSTSAYSLLTASPIQPTAVASSVLSRTSASPSRDWGVSAPRRSSCTGP